MKNVDDPLNTSSLSQSYMQGMRRLAGDPNRHEVTFQPPREMVENRMQSWSFLFDKFSEISDDLELNLQTLRPDTVWNESVESESDVSKPRVPIRKSMAQLQHWVNTGKPPCQVMDIEESYMDGTVLPSHQSMDMESNGPNATVSISESEVSDPNSLEPRPFFTMNQQQVNGRKDLSDELSGSSVDTTTYIKNNTNVMKKTVNLSNNGRVIHSVHSHRSKLSCDKLLESPWCGVVSKDLLNGAVSMGLNCDKRIGDKNGELHSSVDKPVSRNISSPDSDISCNDVFAPRKQFGSAAHENSAVKFQSQNSEIISLPMKSTKDCENLEQLETTANPSDHPISVAENSLHRGKRLYNNDAVLSDIVLYKCNTNVRRSRSIQIKHPALLTPATEKKSKFKPRLLTTLRCPRGKKSRNFSLNLNATRMRRRTKSVLLKKKSPEDSEELPRKIPIRLDFTGSPTVKISEMPKGCSNKSVVVDAENARGITNVDTQLDQVVAKSTTLPGGQKIGTALSSVAIDSNDVSGIIDDKMPEGPKNQVTTIPVKKLPKQSVSLDISMLGDKELRNDCRSFLSSDHQASICKSLPNSSCELTGARMQNYPHTKKNLYTTDLQSCGNSNTSSVVSTANSNNLNASDNSGSSMTCRHKFKSHITSKKLSRSSRADYSTNSVQLSAQFQPIVILHDFLCLRSCCGELEVKNNEQWLNRQGNVGNPNSSTVASNEQAQKRESSSGHSFGRENIILQQLSNIQTVEDKLKMDDKLNHQSKKAEVNKTRGKTKNDNEKKEMTSLCEITSVDNAKNTMPGSTSDIIHQTSSQTLKPSFTVEINYTQKREASIRMHTSSVTFTDTNSNWESIFVLTSSDEEDAIIKLKTALKCRASNRKEAGTKQTNSARLNTTEHVKGSTLQSANPLQSSMSVKKSFLILSSCSEDEDKTAARKDITTSSARLQRKCSKKTKQRDILQSRTTMCSPIHERTDKPESMLVDNGILEFPSTDVNTRLRERKGKQSTELSTASFPSPRSKVNARTYSHKELRKEVMQIPNDSEVGVCNKPNRIGVSESNHGVTENELLKTPVDRTLIYSVNKSDDTSKSRLEDVICSGLKKINSPRGRSFKNLRERSGRSPRSTETKSSRIISRARDKISPSFSSETECQQEEKKGLIVRQVPNYKNKRKYKPESMTFRKQIPVVFTDESSDDDDAAVTSNSKDYTCTDSPGKKVSLQNEKRNMTAISDAPKSSSKKHRRKTCTNSTVVFRTKEYWESDSDNM